jgi:hypothetical protein
MKNKSATAGSRPEGKDARPPIQVIIEYIESVEGVVNSTVLKKSDGQLSLLASRPEDYPLKKIAPFDMFVQVIEGYVEVVRDQKAIRVDRGSGMIIPAHTNNVITSDLNFRLLLTVLNEEQKVDEVLISS